MLTPDEVWKFKFKFKIKFKIKIKIVEFDFPHLSLELVRISLLRGKRANFLLDKAQLSHNGFYGD
jgi:hypothetical protein